MAEGMGRQSTVFPASGRPSARWYLRQMEAINGTNVVENATDTKVFVLGNDIVLRFRVSGNFSEELELYDFPLDVQALTVRITIQCRLDGPCPCRFTAPYDEKGNVSSSVLAGIDSFSQGNVFIPYADMAAGTGLLSSFESQFPMFEAMVGIRRMVTDGVDEPALAASTRAPARTRTPAAL
eukprot:7383569-Prymnesium_polylepis.1